MYVDVTSAVSCCEFVIISADARTVSVDSTEVTVVNSTFVFVVVDCAVSVWKLVIYSADA